MKKSAGVVLGVGLLACEGRVLDVSGAEPGAACEADAGCGGGQVCAVVADARVCAGPVEVHGRVVDAATRGAIAGARVHDESGSVAVSDAAGRFVLVVDAARAADGAPVGGSVVLQAFAGGYRPVPSGLQVALPIAVDAAEFDAGRGAWVIEANTTIGMIAAAGERGATISGRVGGAAPGGTLVVAEAEQAVYGLAGADGGYVLFDVPTGATTIRGYRQGVVLTELALAVEGDRTGVDLAVSEMAPGVVTGSVMLVDAGLGEATSVVLVPASVFDEGLVRGPVPRGLRAGEVTGAFRIEGVPAGKYRVLAAFENDLLVRDPDASIGGTAVPEIDVDGDGSEEQAGSFKVTGALAVIGPGSEGPEVVVGAPELRFARDPGADHYDVTVFDGLGLPIWEATAAKTSGEVAVVYAGPALAPGYYQFRAVSLKDKNGKTALSMTEELRGVFVVE